MRFIYLYVVAALRHDGYISPLKSPHIAKQYQSNQLIKNRQDDRAICALAGATRPLSQTDSNEIVRKCKPLN